MAHNIHFNENTGKHSFFSVKEKAWHGLGLIVDNCGLSSEAIAYAGLDYDVVKSPLFTTAITSGNGDGVTIHEPGQATVPGYYATQRIDTGQVLGVVGSDYRVVQNRDAFTFFDSIADGKGIRYETAGGLGNGYAKRMVM